MEFLDEQAKRKRTIKLFTGYFLIAIIIALSALILVYLAQGYGYDTQKGVTQNGLVFISSKPVSSEITLDNQPKGNTDLRTVLPEGKHTISLKKSKYREWNKSFNLEGGSVLYFLYPRLFPADIPIGVTKVFNGNPSLVTQSPDRRWLVLQTLAQSPNLTVIDLSKPNDEPKLISIPADQLIAQNGRYGTLKLVEWSDDNKHFLVSETMPDNQVYYMIIDIENSDRTVNLSEKFQLSTNQKISLQDKKYDRYYVHNFANGELFTAELNKGLAETPLLSGVVSYKSHGNNIIFYTTYENAKPTEAKVYILNNKTDKYLLKSLPRNSENLYLLDVAKYQNNWYYVSAATGFNKTNIFRNPLKRAKPSNKIAIAPQMSLSLDNVKYVSFSDNTRFIAMQSGKNFVVFDGEQNRVYKYTSPLPILIDQQAKWMDGHRFNLVTDNKVQVFEFDGSNQQTLIASRPEYGGYFDTNYEFIYTLAAQADGKTVFENGKLIAQ